MALRVLWKSNSPLTRTGYASQTATFVPRLKQQLGHEVAIYAFYGIEGSVIEWEGIRIYPRLKNGFGNEITGSHARHFQADIVLTLIDAWVMEPEQWGEAGARWCPYAPVDMEPIPVVVREKLKHAFQPIAYSRFGEREMQRVGLQPLYVPHGIPLDQYVVMPRAEAREQLTWPDDKFVVGMVAANRGWPCRKGYEFALRAFAEFSKRHDDAVLYLHTDIDGVVDGIPLRTLCDYYGLKNGQVAWCDQYRYAVGDYDTSHMVRLYNAFDVLLNVSLGEGFGLPILEAQACGTPVIVGDWTSMSELCWAGWKVGKVDTVPQYNLQGAEWFLPRPPAIAELLEYAYNERGQEALRVLARQGAEPYDADIVTETYWKPVLEAIEARLMDVPPSERVAGPYAEAA